MLLFIILKVKIMLFLEGNSDSTLIGLEKMNDLGEISYNTTNLLAFHTIQKQLGAMSNGKGRHVFLNYPELEKYLDIYY